MINYADSTYYANTYLSGREAVIDAGSFGYYARKATLLINKRTLNRINPYNPDLTYALGAFCTYLSAPYKCTTAITVPEAWTVSNWAISEELQMCCCELAELTYRREKTDGGENIASEKVGEYSVSYADKEKLESVFVEKCSDIINNWLAMTGLLYRGSS